jgi:drug/metabolite transporter (DMT)-like permease
LQAETFPSLISHSGYILYLGGIAGALGNGFIIRALETGDLSVLGPVNAYKSIIGLIFAFILIGEIPNGWGFAGIVLIIAGSYFVLNTMPEKFSWALLKQPAIQYRLAALVLTGIQAVFDKKIIQHSDLTIAFCSWSIFGFIFSIIFFFLNKVRFNNEWKKVNSSLLTKYFALALSVGIMTMSTNYAFKNMPVAEALGPISTFNFGFRLLWL